MPIITYEFFLFLGCDKVSNALNQVYYVAYFCRKVCVLPIFCYILYENLGYVNDTHKTEKFFLLCLVLLVHLILITPHRDEIIMLIAVGCAITFGIMSYNRVKYGLTTACLYALMYTIIQDNGCWMKIPRLSVWNYFWCVVILYTAFCLCHQLPFQDFGTLIIIEIANALCL